VEPARTRGRLARTWRALTVAAAVALACSSRSVRDRAGTLALVGLWKIDYEAAQRRHERLEPARLFFGRVLDRIFILTCWYLLAVMVGVFGFWALLGVARLF